MRVKALLVLVIITTSCTQKLTLSEADQLVRKKYSDPIPITVILVEEEYINKIMDALPTIGKKWDQSKLEKLIGLGLINKYTYSRKTGIEFTDKARPYIDRIDKSYYENWAVTEYKYYYDVLLAYLKFDTIISIEEYETDKMKKAKINAKFKYDDITPFGELWPFYKTETYMDSVTIEDPVYINIELIKYDDGWQIVD